MIAASISNRAVFTAINASNFSELPFNIQPGSLCFAGGAFLQISTSAFIIVGRATFRMSWFGHHDRAIED
jgi:hypothetical protein